MKAIRILVFGFQDIIRPSCCGLKLGIRIESLQNFRQLVVFRYLQSLAFITYLYHIFICRDTLF